MQSPIIIRFEKLIHLAARMSTRSALLGSVLGVVFCMLGFQWLQTRLGAPMLDTMGPYQRDELVERMLLYGEQGRALHFRFTLFLDMVFPFIYGALLAGLFTLAARGGTWQNSVILVPVVMVLDWAENLQLLMLLSGFPDLSTAQISAASATTQGKMLALQFAFLWLIGLFVLKLWRAFLARQ